MNELEKIYHILLRGDNYEYLETNYPKISEYDDWRSFKSYKNYFTHEQLSEFIISLKKKDDWNAYCLFRKDKKEPIFYRGYWFFIQVMSTKPDYKGQSFGTVSWLYNNSITRPTYTYQVKVIKGDIYDIDRKLEVMFYGYVDAELYDYKRKWKKVLMDKVIKKYLTK